MNLFILHENPVFAAQDQCDKHVIKQSLETTQLLCSVFRHQNIEAPYKLSHVNHPCSIFTRESSSNFDWVVKHGLALCNEYTHRYNKIHKSMAVIQWCKDNKHLLAFSQLEPTEFAIAIAADKNCRKIPEFNNESIVNKYRLYYIHDKSSFTKWTNREIPNWFKNITNDMK